MQQIKSYQWRFFFVLFVLLLMIFGLLYRLFDLNVFKRSFLLKESQSRILRTVVLSAHRGMIVDRLGTPLAISAPVSSVWVNPKVFLPTALQLQQLSRLLQIPVAEIQQKMHAPGKEFIYLKRLLPPSLARQVLSLQIPGLYQAREYKRFYPESEVTAHIIGFTNIDDQGQEGLELAFNNWLSGKTGLKEVLIDRFGQVIANVALLHPPRKGHVLVLSIDHRIQYLAYRALKEACAEYNAKAGSIVVLDVKTGEILAMVNQPSYNPNDPLVGDDSDYRNRAVTDTYEPGSVIKPFTIAMALESGNYKANSVIDTNPGWMVVGGFKIRDDQKNNGDINLTQVLQKSSNVGAAKIMLSLQPQEFWNLLSRVGFGLNTGSGFPGEADGSLVAHSVWYPSVVAALAYGYGIAVTTLQLAHAYAILANKGIALPVTFLKRATPPAGVRVIDARVSQEVVKMLEAVVKAGGTGTRAQVFGYRVAGKTGTAYIAGANGYDKHKYMSSFAGIAPVSDPRLVVAVTIREPQGKHFGGDVAAPVFAKVMGGALRILNVAPDNL